MRQVHLTCSKGLDSSSSNPALTSNQLARRWRECHPLNPRSDLTSQEEDVWRRGLLKCLSAAHTIGNFADTSFEVVKSLYSVSRFAFHHYEPPKATSNVQLFELKDFAFELHLEDFVFRWETNIAGHKLSAETISTQLIMPLMSTAHLAFSSPDSVGEMSESGLETVNEAKLHGYAPLIRYGLHACAGCR